MSQAKVSALSSSLTDIRYFPLYLISYSFLEYARGLANQPLGQGKLGDLLNLLTTNQLIWVSTKNISYNVSKGIYCLLEFFCEEFYVRMKVVDHIYELWASIN